MIVCFHCIGNLTKPGRMRNDGDLHCLQGLDCVELVAFFEDPNRDDDNAPVFELLVVDQLNSLAAEKRNHTTRLKNRLFCAILTAHSQRREKLLSFLEGLSTRISWQWCHAHNASDTGGEQRYMYGLIHVIGRSMQTASRMLSTTP